MSKIDSLLKQAAKNGQDHISVRDLQPKRYNFIIGIDPDVDKSGFCLLDVAKKRVFVDEKSITDILEWIKTDNYIGYSSVDLMTLVVIEGSWCTQHNWHLSLHDSKRVTAKKGYQVGRNHQTGMILAQIFEFYGYDVEVQPPLNKKQFSWHGPDGKATHEDLLPFIPNLQHTTQEGRDATLLAWTRAGFPLDNNSARLHEIINRK